MAAIDKAIELLERVLKENYKLSEGYEIKPETRDEIEGWLKWYNDLQKRADGVSPNENSGLTIPVVINWVACSEREPDTEDIYYVYPDKYNYTAEYHKYGKWAGKWTVDDQNGYEYEVHVNYWKVIEPPCL